jgi:uncharacterized protein with HEPN domain
MPKSSMPRDDAVYVGHMLDTARKAVEKVERKSRADFDADENLRLALAHLIQIIGEAASRVSVTFCEEHAEVPWSEIIGMRHKIVHDYLGVDYDIVWEVVTADLPLLADKLERIG